ISAITLPGQIRDSLKHGIDKLGQVRVIILQWPALMIVGHLTTWRGMWQNSIATLLSIWYARSCLELGFPINNGKPIRPIAPTAGDSIGGRTMSLLYRVELILVAMISSTIIASEWLSTPRICHIACRCGEGACTPATAILTKRRMGRLPTGNFGFVVPL